MSLSEGWKTSQLNVTITVVGSRPSLVNPPQHWSNCCAQRWNAGRVCVWPGIASLAKCLAFLGEVCVAAPLSACKQADPSGHSLCWELEPGFTISIVNC